MKATKSIIMTSKTIAAIVLAIMLAMSISSCVKCDRANDFAQGVEKGFRDSGKWGKVIEKELDLKDFKCIATQSNVDIIYTQGDEFKVTVKGNENAISEYVMEVTPEGTFIAKSNSSLNSLPTIQAYITAPTIESIELTGSGDIDIREVANVEDLSVLNTGSGDIYIHDLTCNSLTVKGEGSGDIKFGKLAAEQINGSTIGSGDIDFKHASCTGNATLQTAGSGDIDGDIKAVNISAESQGSGDIDINVDCRKMEISSLGSGEVEVEGYADVLIRDKQGLGLTTTKDLHAKEIQ